MIKLVIMLKKKAGLTTEQFRQHYENSHAVYAMRYFGHLWVEYRRNYPIQSSSFAAHADDDSTSAGENAYDAITEIVMRDQAAFDEMLRILSEPETRKLFSEDEERFTDRNLSRFTVCDVVQSGAYINWPSTK
jgi:EthD domain